MLKQKALTLPTAIGLTAACTSCKKDTSPQQNIQDNFPSEQIYNLVHIDEDFSNNTESFGFENTNDYSFVASDKHSATLVCDVDSQVKKNSTIIIVQDQTIDFLADSTAIFKSNVDGRTITFKPAPNAKIRFWHMHGNPSIDTAEATREVNFRAKNAASLKFRFVKD